MLWILAGCGPTPKALPVADERSDGHGTVLWASPATLVVQHDDTRGRVTPGIERYRWEGSPAVSAGDGIDVWHDGLQLERLVVTGKEPLADGFVADGVPLVGTVVNVDGLRVTVDHEAIPNVMPAMVMGFVLATWETATLTSGDRIAGRLLASSYGWQLVDVEITGKTHATLRTDIAPLAPGEVLPRMELVGEDGKPLILGVGQGLPTLLTFIYTRCPDPAFCPAIAARMAGLQGDLKGARIVTVTLDPENDTPEVLASWGSGFGADFSRWRLARTTPLDLQALALWSGQYVTVDGGKISHLHRVLVLDAEGRLVERYDTADWPRERVLQQLMQGR